MRRKGRLRNKQIVITVTEEEKEIINAKGDILEIQITDVGRELLLSWAMKEEVVEPIRKGTETKKERIVDEHTEEKVSPLKAVKKGTETISHGGRKSREIVLSTGERTTVSEYSERSGIPADVIRQRIKRGTAPDAEYRSRIQYI